MRGHHPAAAHFGRHREAHVAEVVAAILEAGDRQDLPLVQGDRLDHVADGHAHREPGAPFLLDHLGSRSLGAGKQLVGQVGSPAGMLFQRQAIDRRPRPDRYHAVTVFAQDERLDLGGRGTQLSSDQAAEADRVELRAQADDLRAGQVQHLGRQISQHVDRIGDDHHDRLSRKAGGLEGIQDGHKQVDVAVDQIQPAFVRFPPQPGGDADHVAVHHLLVVPRCDHLVGRAGPAVQQVQRLSGGQIGIHVQEGDLADHASQLQGKCRAGTNQTTTANDADLHTCAR